MQSKNSETKKEKQEKKEVNASQENTPVTLLPNPGEGGPIYQGPGMQEENMENDANRPVNLLPNPGEGGPVYSNMGWPNNGWNNNQIPNIIGTIISTNPRPNEPCSFCINGNTGTGNIRFLNAATDYNPFRVFVNESLFASRLSFAELTEYERVSVGSQIITVMGENGYIYIQKPIQVNQNISQTVAIVLSDNGLDLEVITDGRCNRYANMSCVRAVNLAYNSGTLNVVVGNQAANFPNLRYLAAADFTSLWPGVYIYVVSKNSYARLPGLGNTVLLTAAINMQRNKNYTIYLLNLKRSDPDSLKVLVVEEDN